MSFYGLQPQGNAAMAAVPISKDSLFPKEKPFIRPITLARPEKLRDNRRSPQTLPRRMGIA
jgi:hypothetical protein